MTRSRWLFVAGLGLLIVLGLGRLRFETDVLALLPSDLPTVRALSAQQRYFDSSTELVVTVEGTEPEQVEDGARALAESLRAVPGLVRWAVWTPPWEEKPEQAAELLAAAWLSQPPERVGSLRERLEPGRVDDWLAARRARMETSLSPGEIVQSGYDPLGLLEVPGLAGWNDGGEMRFASEDGRYRMILVTPVEGLRGYVSVNAWLERVRGVVASWQAGGVGTGLRVRYTGGPAFTAEISAGMERDMVGSVLGTAAVVVGLFLWAHRRLRPLLALLAILALTLLATLAAGGLMFGRLNAVSLGFAAILLGLAVDYGLILYQEGQVHREAGSAEIRRMAGPGIGWAAATTAVAFAAVSFGGVPGLRQLGVLVAVGTILAAVFMLTLFRVTWRNGPPVRTPAWHGWLRDGWVLRVSPVVILGALLVLAVRGLPALDRSAGALRPHRSEAYEAMSEMKSRLGGLEGDPWWVIAEGVDAGEVAGQLRSADAILGRAGAAGAIASHRLPLALWPDPARQAANRSGLAGLAGDRTRLRLAVEQAGFAGPAFRTAELVLAAWARAGASAAVYWPTNELSTWVLAQVTARGGRGEDGGRQFALGWVRPGPGGDAAPVRERLREAGLLVGSWDSLGSELLDRVAGRLGWVAGWVGVLWLGCLALALRSVRDLVLPVGTMFLGLLLLAGSMSLAGWSWNLMNLMAVPLLFGTGTDYAIHYLLALRRHGGDPGRTAEGVGQAVFLCAATTVAGFGSLAWSNNAGLASLGMVCAAGLGWIYLVSAFVLPPWWRWLHRGDPPAAVVNEVGPPSPGVGAAAGGSGGGGPSALYGPWAWKAAVGVARWMPRPCQRGCGMLGAVAYALLVPGRRRVVAMNLLPVVGGDPGRAQCVAWRNFAAFGAKLADLWYYEAGRPVAGLFSGLIGGEHLAMAMATGRGVLLLTPHLGNWEFGAPLLAARGFRLLVITLAEPGDGLTEFRRNARAKWGIETLVIREDPFAFVEIIRRLGDGALVALLVDRPPAATGVTAEFFGRPFRVSVAGAELARASGCVLLPTILPWTGEGYTAEILPAVPYDRRALGSADQRRELARDILRAFEPAIRQYPDQWFHFVPVWPDSASSAR